MFFFGDAQLLSEKSAFWNSIVEELEEQDFIGPCLPVGCSIHPSKVLKVDGPGVLHEISPQGGCLERCNSSLPCGHVCQRICHVSDREVCFVI